MTRTNAVLFVLTSQGTLGDTGEPTGFYVPEAAHPWRVFTAAGYRVDLVSPLGGQPPRSGLDTADPAQREFLADQDIAAKLSDTPRPDAIDSSAYDAVVYVGGHGTMWDFPGNAALAKIATAIHESGGVVAAVCHGPAGLLDVTLPTGAYLVAGRRVAAFTNSEEDAVGMTNVVPFLLQSALVERGAQHSEAPDFQPHVVTDGRVVTGQNPASATGVAEEVVRLLSG